MQIRSSKFRRHSDRPGIQCQNCLVEVVSFYRHHFNGCWCGAIAIDGGYDYYRVLWDEKYEYLSFTANWKHYRDNSYVRVGKRKNELVRKATK